MNRRQIFMSAITDREGGVNVGYLVLIRSGQMVSAVIATMVTGSLIEFWFSGNAAATPPLAKVFRILELGQGIGLVLGAYGTLLGFVGAFLFGDRKATPSTGLTETTTAVQRTTKEVKP